jgi:hypothetical protein
MIFKIELDMLAIKLFSKLINVLKPPGGHRMVTGNSFFPDIGGSRQLGTMYANVKKKEHCGGGRPSPSLVIGLKCKYPHTCSFSLG